VIVQKTIDMTRPAALYLAAIAVLILAVFIEGRLGVRLVSRGMHLPLQRTLAAGFILTSVAAGLLGAHRYAARVKAPWRVPSSQVHLSAFAFFVLGASAVLLSS